MTEHKVFDNFEPSIATTTPTARQRRLTLVIAAIVLIVTAIIAPFGAAQLRRIDGFIPATESVIIIIDFLTAVLLFSQSRIVGSVGLLLLAGGYLFSALIVLPHLLTFRVRSRHLVFLVLDSQPQHGFLSSGIWDYPFR